MEKSCTIQSENYRLEGLHTDAGSSRAVVVTHPHPLFGGDMYNQVVEAIIKTYRRNGFNTLRFNFRGVGNSQGRYAEGVGEQEDVRAAVAYLIGRGMTAIDLAGYSFGAWVNAKTDLADHPIGDMVLISPPVAMMDFDNIGTMESLTLVITGGQDDIAPADMIRQQIPAWNKTARLAVISGADHFYQGALNQLSEILESLLA